MPRILVVDDDADLRGVLRAILERAGHEVLEAADGAEIDLAKQDIDYDLALVDMYMPVREGIETIRQLRGAHADRPVVAMSGGGGVEVGSPLDMARKLGAQDALPKPFTPDQVLSMVAQLLDEVRTTT